MSETAATIGKIIMPTELGQNTATGESVSRNPRTQSAACKDNSTKTADPFQNQNEIKSSALGEPIHLFSKVLQKKLEKRNKTPIEDKKHQKKEIPPDRLIAAAAGPDQKVHEKSSQSEKIHGSEKSHGKKPVIMTSGSGENTNQKVNFPEVSQKPKSSYRISSETTLVQTANHTEKSEARDSVRQTPIGKNPEPVSLPRQGFVTQPDSSKEHKTAAPASRNIQQAIVEKPIEKTEKQNLFPSALSRESNLSQPTGKASAGGIESFSPVAVRPEMIKADPQSSVKKTKSETSGIIQSSAPSKRDQKTSSLQENRDTPGSKIRNSSENSEKKTVIHEAAWTQSEPIRQSPSGDYGAPLPQATSTNNNGNGGMISPTRPVAEALEPLSPVQQILRSIPTDSDSEIRKIHISLSPPGLGMVKIQFQREGEEISGVLEVQKAETRREIEKSLPQIVAALDAQGIQVRKIEVAPFANPNHKQSSFEGANDWAGHHELSEQGYSRSKPADSTDMGKTGSSIQEIVSNDFKEGYILHTNAENLNFFA